MSLEERSAGEAAFRVEEIVNRGVNGGRITSYNVCYTKLLRQSTGESETFDQ